MREEAVEQLSHTVTLGAQAGIRNVTYKAVEHIILAQIRTATLGKTISEHNDQNFGARKAIEALGKRFLSNDELFAPKASFIQTQTMDTFTEQRMDNMFGSKPKATSAKNDAAVQAEDSLEYEAPARTIYESFKKGSYKGRKSSRASHCTRSRTSRSRNHKYSESAFKLSMIDTDSRRNA